MEKDLGEFTRGRIHLHVGEFSMKYLIELFNLQ